MTPKIRNLLPQLPIELRFEVYKHLSAIDTDRETYIDHLPLRLKTYDCKHTRVDLCPGHQGCTGLLTLSKYNVAEAIEYQDWLLNNAVQLNIGVTFRGRLDTFIPEHWEKRMNVHLNKLHKKHPWLSNVVNYDIRFYWAPASGHFTAYTGNSAYPAPWLKQRRVGVIVKDMAATLMSFRNPNIDQSDARVDIAFILGYDYIFTCSRAMHRLGLANLFIPAHEESEHTWSLLGEGTTPTVTERINAEYYAIPCENPVQRSMVQIENDSVQWVHRYPLHFLHPAPEQSTYPSHDNFNWGYSLDEDRVTLNY